MEERNNHEYISHGFFFHYFTFYHSSKPITDNANMLMSKHHAYAIILFVNQIEFYRPCLKPE